MAQPAVLITSFDPWLALPTGEVYIRLLFQRKIKFERVVTQPAFPGSLLTMWSGLDFHVRGLIFVEKEYNLLPDR